MARFQESRVRDILLGKRAHKTIVFPGTEQDDEPLRVAIRCLTEGEIDRCRARAQQVVRDVARKNKVEPESYHDFDPEYFERVVHRQILALAFYDADTIDDDDPVPFFASDSDVLELDAATSNRLFEAYLEHQNWANPFVQLSEERVQELADALGKAPRPEVPLSAYEREALVVCVVSLASKVRAMTSRTGKSSTG